MNPTDIFTTVGWYHKTGVGWILSIGESGGSFILDGGTRAHFSGLQVTAVSLSFSLNFKSFYFQILFKSKIKYNIYIQENKNNLFYSKIYFYKWGFHDNFRSE